MRRAELQYRRIILKIRKRDGSTKIRDIAAPNRNLKGLQKEILKLLQKYDVSPYSTGFTKSKNIGYNAALHDGADLVIKIDIKDFFPSITRGHVLDVIRRNLNIGAVLYKHEKLFLDLVTLDGKLPQGAPTSPTIANLVAKPLDTAIARYVSRSLNHPMFHPYIRMRYSRYADDLVISLKYVPITGVVTTTVLDRKTVLQSEAVKKWVRNTIGVVTKILKMYGFKVNRKKLRVTRNPARMMVTGAVVNTEHTVPRWRLKRLKAMIYKLTQMDRVDQQLLKQIRGEISFVVQVNPNRLCKLVRTIKCLQRKHNIRLYRKQNQLFHRRRIGSDRIPF